MSPALPFGTHCSHPSGVGGVLGVAQGPSPSSPNVSQLLLPPDASGIHARESFSLAEELIRLRL